MNKGFSYSKYTVGEELTLRCKIKKLSKDKTALTYANSNLPKFSLWQIVW